MLSADEQGGPQGPQGDVWPEPEPAHPRDTPESSALKGVRRGLVREDPAELVKLREENARLKEVLGPGPVVVVGVSSLPELVRYLTGETAKLGLRIEVWQCPEPAVATLLEMAVRVAKEHGMCLPREALPAEYSTEVTPDGRVE